MRQKYQVHHLLLISPFYVYFDPWEVSPPCPPERHGLFHATWPQGWNCDCSGLLPGLTCPGSKLDPRSWLGP